MADKNFGVRRINLIGASGTPTVTSPNNLNLNATQVSISTDLSVGGQVVSNIIVGSLYSVGIGTTNPVAKLDVRGNANITGVATITGNLNAPGNYYVRLGRTSNQTIPVGTDTLIGFSTIVDPNNWYSGITTRTTPTVAGNYQIQAMLNWQAGTTTNANQSNIQLRKNGNTFAISIVGIQTFQYSQFICGIASMNGTTDYIEFTAYTSNATSQTVTGDAGNSYTKMEIFKLN